MDGRKVFAVLLVVVAVGSTAVVVADETEPMADAGLDRSVDLGETVYLDGSGSRAASGEIAEFQWYVTPPDGERELLENGEGPHRTFMPNTTGTYRFTVNVTDTDGKTAEDWVQVYVEDVDPSNEGSDASDDDESGQDDGDDTNQIGDGTDNLNQTTSDPEENDEEPPADSDPETNQSNETSSVGGPSISIEGPTTVIEGETREFTGTESDRIDEYYWIVDQGGTVVDSADHMAEIEFSSEKNTANIKLAAFTPSNDVLTDEKEVAIAHTEQRNNTEVPEETAEITNLEGELLEGGESALFEYDVFDGGFIDGPIMDVEQQSVEFTADVTSPESLDLEYMWDFDDGTETITHQPQVEHKYRTNIGGKNEYEVELTVVDQYGRKESASRTATIIAKHVDTSDKEVRLVEKSDKYLTATYEVRIPRTSAPNKDLYELNFGDGSSINILPNPRHISEGTKTHKITHQYEKPGTYTAWLSASSYTDTGEDIRETVTFDSYTEYHYTERTTAVAEHVSKDDPGEGWEKAGIESIDEQVVDREETRIRDEQNPDALLSDDWRRTGTETEAEQRRETQVAANWPGSDWSMNERAVDTETRIVGYDHVEVPHRSLAPNDGTYVGTTTNYHTTTEQEQSTSRPSGSGWSRVRSTGQVRDGTDTTWRSSRRAPSASWRIVDSRTVTDYYTETERYCKERTNSWFGEGRCIDWGERTVWKSDTSREYKFEYPTYSTEYLWERTVSTPEVYYEYRVPEYGQQDLHRWERTYTDEVEYGVYEKLEYETTTTYEWEKEVEREVEQVSLTPPNTDEVNVIGDVSERVVACGSGDGELEDEGCS